AGMGMANAAMTTQKMLDEYHPKAVLLSGIAGAIDSAVKIGDIVVCSEWIEHDYGYIGKDGFQSDSLAVYIPSKNNVVNEKVFHADSAMLAMARVIEAESLKLQVVGDRTPQLRVGGVGVTGNQFIDSKEKRAWLTKEFKAEITDMESSAVAQVCTVNGVPFVIFRSASDLAGGSGSSTAQVEIEQFFKHAAANSATVVIEYLRRI
ncbi:MAG TPA: 5'-methylthioadenosine/S-adenosylhomocysteine nucleosidase, partial [Candidatus Acidoferrum sp.]|nr:5'-methylthioadenosine/S-adenosylhomocysteine nucleosidase [Candidatus Acidoferrum sp.]